MIEFGEKARLAGTQLAAELAPSATVSAGACREALVLAFMKGAEWEQGQVNDLLDEHFGPDAPRLKALS